MAKFTPGPAVAAVSGSVGGTTFSRNRYGAYMRFRAIPTVSVTSYALTAKARLATASQAWQSITGDQRLAWNQWARTNPIVGSLGFPQILTGHAAYVGNHTRALVYGGTPLTEPPVSQAPAPLQTLSLTADIGAGDVALVFTATPTGANDVIWTNAAVTDSAGIVWVRNLMRHIHESGGAQASPLTIQAVVEGRLGTLQVGQTVHVAVHIFNNVTFQLSPPLVASAVVVTT